MLLAPLLAAAACCLGLLQLSFCYACSAPLPSDLHQVADARAAQGFAEYQAMLADDDYSFADPDYAAFDNSMWREGAAPLEGE